MTQPQPKQREIFQVARDAADPIGTGLRGVSPGYNLTNSAIAHPVVLWQAPDGAEMLLTFDLFAPPNGPRYLLIGCPMCALNGRANALRIMDGGAKAFEWEMAPPPLFPGWSTAAVDGALVDSGIDIRRGGRLQVEPFGCTWEEKPELRRGFGLWTCPWRVAITNNVARRA